MKTYDIIGWLGEDYGKWNIEAENEDKAVEILKGMHPDKELVVVAITTTM